MTACPCCGAEVRTDKPIVDLNTNYLIFGEHCIRLRPAEAELAHILVKRMPATVTLGALHQQLWGLGEPDGSRTTLRVYAYRLRRALRDTSLHIDSVPTVGYRMSVDEVPHAA